MKLIKVTVPQNGQNSPAFDTEGLPLAALTYFNVDVLDGTPALKFQTPRFGQDPGNPSTTWVDVLEVAPGISTDADDAGTLAPSQSRPLFEIPNLILEGAGAGRNHFYLVQSGKRVPKFHGTAGAVPGEDETTGTATTEASMQHITNQIARLSNSFAAQRLPNTLRIALGVNQTTAAVDFWLGFAEPQRFVNNPGLRPVEVTIANATAFSTFFELAPGEKLVAIQTPAAFTTTDLVLETVKPGLDPIITTDANWLALSGYVTEQTLLTGSVPEDVVKLVGAAQDQYLMVPDLSNYIELPRYLRLKGSGNQGAARTVVLWIQ